MAGQPRRFGERTEPASTERATCGSIASWEVALRGVFQFRTVHALDVGERANGIAIAVADRSEEGAIRSFIADAAVPLDAVRIEVRGPDAPL